MFEEFRCTVLGCNGSVQEFRCPYNIVKGSAIKCPIV
jgi:hypothetical protein